MLLRPELYLGPWSTLRHAITASAARVCGHQVPSEKERQLTNAAVACIPCKWKTTTDVSVIR